jgi:hypothetical protein
MLSAPDGSFYVNAWSELGTVLQIPSSSSRAELFPNPSSNDESGLVRRLRDQVSCLNKDITSLRAMASLVKKKGEIATAVEQYALDGLHVATESLGCKY